MEKRKVSGDFSVSNLSSTCIITFNLDVRNINNMNGKLYTEYEVITLVSKACADMIEEILANPQSEKLEDNTKELIVAVALRVKSKLEENLNINHEDYVKYAHERLKEI